MGIRVLVCGGRNVFDRERIYQVLDAIHDLYTIEVLIEGEAKGADSLARAWAEEQTGILIAPFKAQWAKFGKAAGPIRNKQMLDDGQPDLVVAFPFGPLSSSLGTRNMVEQARKAGVRVVVNGIDDITEYRAGEEPGTGPHPHNRVQTVWREPDGKCIYKSCDVYRSHVIQEEPELF